MGKKLVRQFKTHNAPAGARGYRTQATVEYPQLPPAGVVNVTPGGIPVPTADGVVSIRATPERPMAVPPTETEVRTPRAMGTPALPPDWYPETPNRIWTPDASSGTRRNTGAEDIPTITTTNTPLTGFFPQTEPEFVEATITPNFPTVDITPEQFTLPPQQQQIIHERPTTIDYGPITTPIERSIQEDMGYIDTQQPIDLTPGHQVVATETSSFEPQPVESAYAYPIQVDYPQPTLNDPNPVTDTVETDEITNLIDTLLPEQQEAKTIQIYEEGPQWVEDPHALAAQEAIDQGGFDQTDPSLIDRGLPPIIDQSPEITYHGNLADWDAYNDPFVIDYSDTYGEPTLPQQEFPQVFTPEPIVEQPPITLPPELGMPEIPVVPAVDDDPISAADIRAGLGTIEEIPLPTGESIGITPETVQPPIGANPMVEATITSNPDLVVPVAADTSTTGGTVTGGVQAGDDFFGEDRQFKNAQESTGVNEQFAIPGGGPVERDPVGATAIVEALEEGTAIIPDDTITDTATDATIPAKTITPEGIIIDDSDKTYTVDTSAGVDIEQLPETPFAGEVAEGPMVDPPLKDFTPEIADPPAPITVEDGVDVEVDQGGKVDPALTTPGTGGRKWLHTGPADFAETLHQFKTNRGSSGPPIVTDTPAVSGPVVNRETGEITREPLTWHQFNPAGSSVSPYGATTIGGTTDTTGTTDTGKSGGLLTGGFDSTQLAEMAGGSITPVLDYLHPGATSDGQTVTFGDVGNYDSWIDGELDLDPTLKGLKDLGYQKRDAEGNRVGWGNHALDGFNQLTGAINNVFDFMGDPSKGKFTAAILEDFGMMPTKGGSLKEMASNFNKFHEETSQMWETSQDKAWGRKWNDLTQTQEYGDMQPLGIFALLTNPPAALAMTANSLLYDFKNAAQGMFDANPNYKGNMAQDVLNGAFHLLGKGAKKVGSLFGKLGKAIGGKQGKGSGDKQEFTDKDVKLDPMEVSRRLLYASKNEDPAVGDVRYELVKTLLENGVPVRFHNNALSFDATISKTKLSDMKKVLDNLSLSASNLELLAGADGLDDFPELQEELKARWRQWRDAAQG